VLKKFIKWKRNKGGSLYGTSYPFSIGPVTTLMGKSKYRKSGLEKVRYFISRLQAELIIIDPYFYNAAKEQCVDDYMKEISSVLCWFERVKRIHGIYNRKYHDREIRKAFMKLQREYSCKFTDTHTKLIHDRVWMGLGLDTRTPIGKGVVGILSSIAQMERETLKEKQKQGIESARKAGVHLGRPRKFTPERLKDAVEKYHLNKYTLSEIERMTGVSRPTLYRAIKAEKTKQV